MKDAREAIPPRAVRGSGQKGLTATKAVAILVATTITVGIVGYVLLGVVDHAGTHTVSTCASPAPRCGGNTTSSAVVGFAVPDFVGARA
jgi:hypothetical protein